MSPKLSAAARLVALVLIASLLVSPARAAEVAIITGDTGELAPGVTARDTGDFSFVVFADQVPANAGLQAIDRSADEEIYLVELGHGLTAEKLGTATRMVLAGEHFAIVAATDAQSRQLDRLQACRERISWAAPQAAGPQIDRPLAARADPLVKTNILDTISEARFSQIVREISGNIVFWLNDNLESTNNRYTYTAGSGDDIDIAAAYFQDRFEAAGYPVTRQSFNVSSTTTDNIIAIKEGTTYPDEIIVVGAHYDSISENPTVLAPGAEDNGSGSAAVLHLAEVLKDYQTERTIHFILFSGEEQGLHGSQYYVSQLGANGWTVVNALTMDMIAGWETNYRVIIEGQHAWEPLMSLLESNVATYSQIISRKDYFSFGSDHVPFQNAGISALLAIDWDYDAYDHYHKTTDTWQYLDSSLGYRIMTGVAATLVDLTNPTPVATAAPAPATRLALAQNSPNPFNPRTVIHFELAGPGRANLRVYDLAGRLVQILVDQDLEAGRHLARWDGTDRTGRQVSSGNYLLRLESGGEVQSRTMTLVR